MNSSLRIEAASGIWPFSKLAAASLNDTSLTLSENVEKLFSRVRISGWGTGALAGGLGNGWSACGATGFGFNESSEAFFALTSAASAAMTVSYTHLTLPTI